MTSETEIQPYEIIIFTPFIRALGGVERLMLGLSNLLHAAGRAHRLVCFEDTIDLPSHANWPVAVQRLRARRSPWAEAQALRRFLTAARKKGAEPPLLFDLKSGFYSGLTALPPFFLHLTDPPSLLPTDGSKNAISARIAYRPFRSLPRSAPLQMFHAELVHRLNRRGVRRARKLFAMTHRIASELEQLYGKKAEIIRPGVALPRADRKAALPGRELRFLTVSRLEKNKRVDWILDALQELEAGPSRLSDRADWTLHVVGVGSQSQRLEGLAVSKGLEERVIFHGLVSDSRLERIYADADLFVMPAVQGYGLPALEALARKIPVILHRESGVAEILHDTKWAQIIDHDVRDLTSALSQMVDRVHSRILETERLPAFPTERQWASQLARACGWVAPSNIGPAS